MEAEDSIPPAERSEDATAECAASRPLDTATNTSSPELASSPASNAQGETGLDFLATARDQNELERDLGRQADVLLIDQADERDKKRLEKTEQQITRHRNQLRDFERQLAGPGGSVMKNKIRADKSRTEALIHTLEEEVEQIKGRIAERHIDNDGLGPNEDDPGSRRHQNETRKDFLIRTGKITPFSRVGGPRLSTNLEEVLLDAEQGHTDEENIGSVETTADPRSHVNLKRPGFLDADLSETSSVAERPANRGTGSQGVHHGIEDQAESGSTASDEEFILDLDDRELAALGETAEEKESQDEDDYALITPGKKKRKARELTRGSKKAKKTKASEEDDPADDSDLDGVDDGDENVYQARVKSWSERRRNARNHAQQNHLDTPAPLEGSDVAEIPSAGPAEDSDSAEWYQPHPTHPDTELEGGCRIPGDIYPALFDYQKTGVRWLWELYQQRVGGIVGDEMGLGKTIQAISIIAALHHSKKLTLPVIIVTPATVMKQWVKEFHQWWPPLRVSILHSSGSGMMNVRREREIEDEIESEMWKVGDKRPLGGHHKAAKKIVDRVVKDGHVLVTTYTGLQTFAKILSQIQWGYAVLDEGHKIRNPDTAITMYSKMIRTHNRIILSGTPIQNNLTELWSLFDFVYPMRLGSLVTFRNQFEFPIKQGGYANASNLQVETAARCAEALKETIGPYLLQRFKVDVAQDLPKKTERIMFCKLTKLQRDSYASFLNGDEMSSILKGSRQALYGIDLLRKICNHPDLANHKTLSKEANYDYGNPSKSGKMQVVKEMLKIWKNHGHKTLLFAQHRIMLDILERLIRKMDGINYLRMDGNTSIQERQNLVDHFNRSKDIHVFLLTTKVGGLGVNLTGADRVLIYDPDWNPSTDAQARERAWRLGQKREVEIYRLLTAGTIEEKIYHRQVFKQFLTNKILRDPKSRQTFQLKDLHDLFTLGDASDETETGSMFKNTKVSLTDSKATGATTGAHAEVDAIRGLQRQEDYAAADEEKRTDGNETDKPDRLLSSIFSGGGVHSLHEHDAIINPGTGKKKLTADADIISREAKRIANNAAKELRKAGELARHVPAGQTTWTGLHGTTGRPEERPRPQATRGGFGGRGGRGGGPSSSSVLTGLAARQNVGGGANASASSSRDSTPQRAQPRTRDFLKMIIQFLKTHGGVVYSQMLVQHFNRQCVTERDTAQFQEMLKVAATLDKGPRGQGRGRWILKDEWKS